MVHKHLSRAGDESVCVSAVLLKGDSVLLGYRNYTPDKWKTISVWIAPGGRCDPGETLEQTLRREVLEEVDISDIEIVEWIGEVPGAKEGDKLMIFFCKTDQEPTLMEPEKFSEWRWFTVRDYIAGRECKVMNQHAQAIVSNFLKEKFPI